MPQGKCAFCGTFVTGGGTALGRHSVACTACTPLALQWLRRQGLLPADEAPKSDEPEAASA
jgi:hypothetical protein